MILAMLIYDFSLPAVSLLAITSLLMLRYVPCLLRLFQMPYQPEGIYVNTDLSQYPW